MPYSRFGMTLAEVKRDHIIETVKDCGGNRTRAAKVLRVSIRSLRMKMKEYQRCGVDVVQHGDMHATADHYQWEDPIH